MMYQQLFVEAKMIESQFEREGDRWRVHAERSGGEVRGGMRATLAGWLARASLRLDPHVGARLASPH